MIETTLRVLQLRAIVWGAYTPAFGIYGDDFVHALTQPLALVQRSAEILEGREQLGFSVDHAARAAEAAQATVTYARFRTYVASLLLHCDLDVEKLEAAWRLGALRIPSKRDDFVQIYGGGRTWFEAVRRAVCLALVHLANTGDERAYRVDTNNIACSAWFALRHATVFAAPIADEGSTLRDEAELLYRAFLNGGLDVVRPTYVHAPLAHAIYYDVFDEEKGYPR